jgi:hypothetical protein
MVAFSFDKTRHYEGDSIFNFIDDFKSGWSNNGNTRLAKYGSNCVYKYCFPSTSVKLTQPFPSLSYEFL